MYMVSVLGSFAMKEFPRDIIVAIWSLPLCLKVVDLLQADVQTSEC